MKTIAHRLFPAAAVLACAAGSALGGGNSWLDNGNTAASNNILGALNNVPVNITSNSQTILRVQFSNATFVPSSILYETGSIVGGYWGNEANAAGCLVLGGYQSTVASVTTPHPNRAQDFGCTILAGADNSAGDAGDSDVFTQPFATVVGGLSNEARGAYSTVIGGRTNEAKGFAATNLGGQANRAGGDYSMAGGFSALVRDAALVGDSDGDQGCFVWSDRSVTNADFATTGPNQFLVRAAGGMGVGTNTPTGVFDSAGAGGFSFPQFVVKCTTNASDSWSRVAFTNTNTNKFWHFSAKCNGAANSDDQLNYYYQSGTQGRNVMQMRGDGRMSIGGQAPATGVTLTVGGSIQCVSLTQTSSQRYKTDVATLPSVLDRFLTLRPVSFTWDDAHGGAKDVGLIAEEVAAVFPEAVATVDGQVEGINFSRVTALAIQAMKEQQERVVAGQERMTRLEAENADLKARLERIEKALAK